MNPAGRVRCNTMLIARNYSRASRRLKTEHFVTANTSVEPPPFARHSAPSFWTFRAVLYRTIELFHKTSTPVSLLLRLLDFFRLIASIT
jgi:hypothetical protein